MGILRSPRLQSLKTHSTFAQVPCPPTSTVAALLFALVLVAPSASAEPFRITSGMFNFSLVTSGFTNVSGPDFRVTGDTSEDEFGLRGLDLERTSPTATKLPVSGNTHVDFAARLRLSNGSLGDRCCITVFDLTFTGPAADAHPDETLCPKCVSGTSPFRVTGLLRAISDDREGPELFRHTIAGTGIATVGFEDVGGLRPFARFEFSPEAATPEPGTLLLLVSGALGAARRERRPKL